MVCTGCFATTFSYRDVNWHSVPHTRVLLYLLPFRVLFLRLLLVVPVVGCYSIHRWTITSYLLIMW